MFHQAHDAAHDSWKNTCLGIAAYGLAGNGISRAARFEWCDSHANPLGDTFASIVNMPSNLVHYTYSIPVKQPLWNTQLVSGTRWSRTKNQNNYIPISPEFIMPGTP